MTNNEAIEVITHFDKHIRSCDEYGYLIDGELMEAHLMAAKALRNGWIPVSERLPDKDGKYLCFHRGVYANWIQAVQFAKDARKFDEYAFRKQWKNKWLLYDSEYGYYAIDSITHWMPLPEPPKENDHE